MSVVHFPGGALSETLALAFAPRRDRGARRVGASAAAAVVAVVAVVAFVVVSLALSSLVNLALGSMGVADTGLIQIIGYFAIAGAAMVATRRFVDLLFAVYRGRWVVFAFLGIDAVLLVLAMAARRVEVDYVVSISQMAALCVFAYLQFWTWRGPGHAEAAD